MDTKQLKRGDIERVRDDAQNCTSAGLKWMTITESPEALAELAALALAAIAPSDAAGAPVAQVDEGDDGLFVEILYGEDGSSLKRGDKLYAAPVAPAAAAASENAKPRDTWELIREINGGGAAPIVPPPTEPDESAALTQARFKFEPDEQFPDMPTHTPWTELNPGAVESMRARYGDKIEIRKLFERAASQAAVKLTYQQVEEVAKKHQFDMSSFDYVDSNSLVDLVNDAMRAAAPQTGDDASDAARYRWLRARHWSESTLFVVNGHHSLVRLGTNCPNDEQLDAAIDAARQGGQS